MARVARGKIKEDEAQRKDVPAGSYSGPERRVKARVRVRFPATVRGTNANGEAFEIETHVNNLSTGGLHVTIAQSVKQGAKLFIIIWLAPTPNREVATARLAVRSKVVRVELEDEGAYGVAVALTHYRFL